VPHPALAGTEATLQALRDVVTAAGANKVLGFVYEIVQERTGLVLPRDFMTALAALRKELDLPLIAVETTTHTYRSGLGAFASPAMGLIPDALTWWGGGQTGYIHTSTRWFVPGPLTLVSTWDGDELSLIRQHHQLRAARHLDVAGASKALEHALGKSSGLGAYRVFDATPDALESFAEHHIAVRQFPNGKLGIIPALDQIEAATKAIGEAL
jgi:4-aminobutyrate aminotransferase-like enzyme